MKKQKKKEQQLMEEQAKQRDEMLMVEHDFKNLQEEVDENREVVKELRVKYKGALEEIKDLEQEHQQQKEELCYSLRTQNQELMFYKGIVQMMLKSEELNRIRAKATYDEDKGEYDIPVFYLRKNEMNFPKLRKNQKDEFLEQEKADRTVEFGPRKGSQNVSTDSNNAAPERGSSGGGAPTEQPS